MIKTGSRKAWHTCRRSSDFSPKQNKQTIASPQELPMDRIQPSFAGSSGMLVSSQTHAETFPDGAPIRCRYLRVHQVLAWYPFRRAKLYELLSSGMIKSFVLRERGAQRGCRLIDRDSLDAFLEEKAAEAEAASV